LQHHFPFLLFFLFFLSLFLVLSSPPIPLHTQTNIFTTTTTIFTQKKNEPLSTNLNFDAFTAKVAAVAVRLENCRPLDRALL
jgi:hypothetical protein